MNLVHLEMMKNMLRRVTAGSWEPALVLKHDELLTDGYQPEATVKLAAFSLDHWVIGKGVTNSETGKTCGFSACAVGHACFDEEFRKLGWEWNDYGSPMYKGVAAWDAVQKFFEIKDGTDEYLFMDGSYLTEDGQDVVEATPAMVADRIEELMLIGEDKFREKYSELLNESSTS